jgi:hypothetical protein
MQGLNTLISQKPDKPVVQLTDGRFFPYRRSSLLDVVEISPVIKHLVLAAALAVSALGISPAARRYDGPVHYLYQYRSMQGADHEDRFASDGRAVR